MSEGDDTVGWQEGRDPFHVLLIHQLYVGGHEAGGTRHHELAHHMANRGARVSVVTSAVSYLTGRLRAPSEAVDSTDDRIRVLRSATFSPRGQGFVGRVASFVSFMASSFLAGLRVRDVDVVWGTTPPIFQAVTALALSRLKRVPFALEVRDLWPDFAVELGVLRNPLLIGASRWLERALYRSADAIIVNSPGFMAHVERLAPAVRIRLVPNGTDPEAFDPDDRGLEIRKELGAEDRFVVLYAGAHGVPNDLDVVLDAAAALTSRPDVLFVLVGDGRDRHRLQGRARELGLENVRFVAPQSKSRMPAVLAASDVCLAILKPLPMFTTTYPNKVFDYMAAGRPTLLAIDGVIREVVEEAGGGRFVAPGDSAALAEAVLEYAGDPERRAREGQAARAFVSERFRREIHAEALRRVLGELVVEATRQGPRGPLARSPVS